MSTIWSCPGPLDTLMSYYCLYLLFNIFKLNVILQSGVSRIHFEFLYRNSYLFPVVEVSLLSMMRRTLDVLLIVVQKIKSLDLLVDRFYFSLMVYKLWKSPSFVLCGILQVEVLVTWREDCRRVFVKYYEVQYCEIHCCEIHYCEIHYCEIYYCEIHCCEIYYCEIRILL